MSDGKKSDEIKKNVIKGEVTEGEFKGQQIRINFGDSPASTRIVIGDNILSGVSKLTIIMDCNNAVNMIEIEKWLLPEG